MAQEVATVNKMDINYCRGGGLGKQIIFHSDHQSFKFGNRIYLIE